MFQSRRVGVGGENVAVGWRVVRVNFLDFSIRVSSQSSGDGLPNTIGKESYIYDNCPHGTSADCMKGHIL